MGINEELVAVVGDEMIRQRISFACLAESSGIPQRTLRYILSPGRSMRVAEARSVVEVRDGQLVQVTIRGTSSISSRVDPADHAAVERLIDDVWAAADGHLVRVEVLPG